MDNVHMCDYGCGQEAKFQLKNGKWSCSQYIYNCKGIIEKKLKTFTSPEFSEKMRKSHLGVKRSPEVCQRLREIHTGKKHSLETRKKIGEKSKGRKAFLGKKHTKETIEKIRRAATGRKHSPEVCKRLREILTGRKRPPELVERIRLTKIGKRRKCSKETIEKIRKALTGIKRSEEYRKKLKEMFKTGQRGWSVEWRERQRNYMLNGGNIKAQSGIQNPSKPQVELFKNIKKLYSDAKINYPFHRREKGRCYFLDVAIPELKICFESNGSYWHKKRKKEDLIRKMEIENEGWTMIEYHDIDYVKQVPTIEKIKEDIENVINYLKEVNYDKAQASS